MGTAEILVAILAFLGVLISQWTMFAVQIGHGKQINEINDAVNHRHERGGKKLYDLVLDNHSKTSQLEEWNRRQDVKIDNLTHKVDSLPCFAIADQMCPDPKE